MSVENEDVVRIPAELYEMISEDVGELVKESQERSNLLAQIEEGIESMSIEEMLTSGVPLLAKMAIRIREEKRDSLSTHD